MDRDAVVRALRQALGNAVGPARALPLDDVLLPLELGALREAADLLVSRCGVWHLSTITGLDDGEGILLLYHFWHRGGLTLSVRLPYEAPTAPTLTDLIPGAVFYEREVAEMLGVTFDGHEAIEPLLLPEDWDVGPPLRREVDAGDGPTADRGGGGSWIA